MRYQKTLKPGLLAASTISLKELNEMAAFIRSFKEKYSRRKTAMRKKK
jgi:hypothetical protein